MTTQATFWTRAAGVRESAAGRGSWPMLAVLLLGQFMCIIDVFIVNVAMPSIGASLHASGASLQLVVGGYTAAYAMLLITGARLGDLHGRRRVYLAGMAVFTASSLACGLAPDGAALVAFRFAQGAGAAAAVPQIFSLIQMRFTGPARAKALSAYAVVLSTGAAAGLVAGGVIVTANLFGESWRPVFWLNVPLGLALIIGARSLVPADEPARARGLDAQARGLDAQARGLDAGARGLDLAGLAIAALSILLVVLPLVVGSEAGWPAWSWCAIAAGLALAVLFARVERKIPDPLLNLEVLRAPGLGLGLAALGCTQIAYGGLLFAFTLHLREGLGDSALRAGLSYLPMAVTFGLAGLCWRRLPVRVHRKLPIAGTLVSALGYLALAVHGDLWTWGALAVIGAGLGLAASPLLTLSLRDVPPARAADASGLLTTAIQLAQLTGVAALGAVYLAGTRGRGAAFLAGAARAQVSGHAMTVVSWWMAALSAVGALAAIALARTSR